MRWSVCRKPRTKPQSMNSMRTRQLNWTQSWTIKIAISNQNPKNSESNLEQGTNVRDFVHDDIHINKVMGFFCKRRYGFWVGLLWLQMKFRHASIVMNPVWLSWIRSWDLVLVTRVGGLGRNLVDFDVFQQEFAVQNIHHFSSLSLHFSLFMLSVCGVC